MSAHAASGHTTHPVHLQAIVSDDRRTFRLTRVGSVRGRRTLAVISALLGALGLFLALAGLVFIVSPSSSGPFAVGIFWLPLGLYLVWTAAHIQLRAPVVRLTDTELRSRDSLGFTWSVARSDVVSVDIGASVLPKASVASRIPYVRKADGSRLWLTALTGNSATVPADAAQLDVVRDLRAALNVGGTDDDATVPSTTLNGVAPRRDSWLHGPRASATITALFFLAFQVGLWSYLVAGLIGRGIHEDDLRHASGATVVTMQVDDIVADCYRGCTYQSRGTYLAPWSGATVTDVRVRPNYQERHDGFVDVVVSPGHPRDALQAGYTGKGDIVAGSLIGGAASLIPLGVGIAVMRRMRRHARVRRLVTAVANGAEPTGRFRGILRGPGINPYVAVSNLEITPTELIEVEKLIGGDHRWTVALTDVSDVEFPGHADTDLAPSPSWQTVRFRTPAGTYTVTCDAAYVPLVKAALERRRAVSDA